MTPPLQATLTVPAAVDAPLVAGYAGDLGEAGALRLEMARGAVGAYAPVDYARFVSGMQAFGPAGEALSVEAGDGGWTVRGTGRVTRIQWTVDIVAAAAAIKDSLVRTTRRSAHHLLLSGYGVFPLISDARDRPFLVSLEMPEGWRAAWGLARTDDGRFRAETQFELLDEPAMLGTAFVTRPLDELRPPRRIHGWVEGGASADTKLDVLSRAAAYSAKGIQLLGMPPLDRPYHIFFEFLEPREGRKLGWALEHGYSFHCVFRRDWMNDLKPGLTYHVIHHEMHAWMPRRLYTASLAPWKQAAAVPTPSIWLAEGLVQYLSFCALGRAGAADIETTVDLLADRFVPTYLNKAPPTRPSLAEHSRHLSTGEHTYWRWCYAAGGLLSLLIDQSLDAAGKDDLVEVHRRLYEEHAEKDLPDEALAGELARLSGVDVSDLFAAHVNGAEPLPLEEILAGIGVMQGEAGELVVLPDDKVGKRVAAFRRKAFGAR